MKRTPIAVISLCTIFISWTAGQAHAEGDPEAAKAKLPLCVGCHGPSGEGKDAAQNQPAYPALAGQREAYFIKAANAYKSDERKDPIMSAIAKGLSDADIANLAAYYASLR